ncbi:MAG: hypothetical protein IPP17_00580 [Bacteroidetes bacterium]|nr:hypothetical protein [Bacteroidota bacterium]
METLQSIVYPEPGAYAFAVLSQSKEQDEKIFLGKINSSLPKIKIPRIRVSYQLVTVGLSRPMQLQVIQGITISESLNKNHFFKNRLQNPVSPPIK